MTTLATSLWPQAPFDFDLTAGYHTYFQSRSGADNLEDGSYRRLLDLDGKLALASVRSVGSIGVPELTLEVEGRGLIGADLDCAAAQVGWLLGLEQDLAPFYSLAESDPVLGQVVERSHGLHVPHTGSVFEALVLAVLGQQISAKVARTMRMLIIEAFGRSGEFGGQTYYAFPRPEAIRASSPEVLQTMKLTRRKSEYIHGIAGAALDPAVGLEGIGSLGSEEAVRRLTALRGVGRWTAQWALIRATGHADALPLGDLALRRAVSRLYKDGAEVTDAEVEELAVRWAPCRTFATVYLFSALRTGMI